MKAPFALAAALLLAASATAQAGGQAPAARVTAAESRVCLDLSSIVGRRAEDERTIRFETLDGRVYRNRLAARCPGLRQSANGFAALAFDVQGGRLCRGDRVRVVDRSAAGLPISCPLGAFEPVRR